MYGAFVSKRMVAEKPRKKEARIGTNKETSLRTERILENGWVSVKL